MAEAWNAGDICTRIVVCERHTPLLATAQRVRELHVGCVVVVDEAGGGRWVAGMLTDRDLVTSVLAQAVESGQRHARHLRR